MNRSIVRISIVLLILFGLLLYVPGFVPLTAHAQAETPTNTPAPTETQTPKPTKTLKPTKTPTATLPAEVVRPLVVIESSDTGGSVTGGKSFDLVLRLKTGEARALIT